MTAALSQARARASDSAARDADVIQLHPGLPERSNDEVKAEATEKLNRRYAFVHAVGSQTAILDTQAIDATNRYIKKSDFFDRYANRKVRLVKRIGAQGQAEYREENVAKIWFEHPDRAEYSHVVFSPGQDVEGAYNLWRGWGVEPASPVDGPRVGGTFRLLRAHILHNLADGNREHAEWIWDWFAAIFQRPQQKCGTALTLVGEQGVGKSVLGEIFGRLLGDAYASTSDLAFVLGEFNAGIEGTLLLQMDEAVWGGDKKQQGRLKDEITRESRTINQKYVPSYSAKNFTRFLFTSNEDWAVPVEVGDRRFAVFYVNSRKKEDSKFFRRLFHELERNGGAGYRALLAYLLTKKIDWASIRRPPRTRARGQQMLRGLDDKSAWWYGCLAKGQLPGALHADGWITTDDIYADFIRHSQAVGLTRRSTEMALAAYLRDWVPGLEKRRRLVVPYPGAVSRQVTCYKIPDLASCREYFAQRLGQPLEWDEGSDEWVGVDASMQVSDLL